MSGSRTLVIAAAVGAAAALAACADRPAAPTPTASPSAFSDTAARAGDGNTPARLVHAGWFCENVPNHGVHCMDPHASVGSSVHIQVKVFDTSDPGSSTATFLGTESLIHADHYRGQPCLPGHGQYFLLPFGYYACHHFDF